MEFQALFNPIGTGLKVDAQRIANAGGLVDVLAKQQELETAKKQQAILDQLASTSYEANRPGISAANVPGDGPTDIEGMLGMTQRTAQEATAKAKALSAYPKAAAIYQQQANQATERYTALIKERQDKNEKQIAYVQNLAGTMTESEEGFDDGLAQLKSSYPDMLARVPFQKEPDGAIKWNPTNQRIAQNLYKSSVAQKDAWAREKQVFDIVDKQQDNERQERQLAQQKLDQDRQAAQRAQDSEMRREELGFKREERAAARTEKEEQTDLKRSDKLVKTAQDHLIKSSPVYKNIDNYKRALGTAEMVEAQLKQPGGFRNITPATGQALVNSYRNLATEYRTRTGGKYDAGEVAKLDGALQKMERWFLTIGSGDNQVSRQSSMEIIDTVRKQFDNANRIVVMDELKQVEKLEGQKVDPSRLSLKGDYGRFVATPGNGASLFEKDGKRYLKIKGAAWLLPEGAQ